MKEKSMDNLQSILLIIDMKRKILIGFLFAILIVLFCYGATEVFSYNKVNVLPGIINNQEEIESVIYLIGDAGDPSADRQEPSLAALQNDASDKPVANKIIIFLGDNIYESGMPELNSPDRKEMERRINEQIKVIKYSKSEGIFIPGNHDWNKWSKGGADAIKRQEEYIKTKSDGQIKFLPGNGCPGPYIADFGRDIRIIALDTQWWLMNNEERPTEKCRAKTETEVLNQLVEALKTADDRKVIVVGHHPINSYGEHAGFFNWKAHLFPLTALGKVLWVPLPGLGSLYPLSRKAGILSQDFSAPGYAHLIEQLKKVFSEHPPMVYASGHEHSLQVLKEKYGMLQLVSGGGLESRIKNVGKGKNTVFKYEHSGFMRLDFLKNGKVKLNVIVPGIDNKAKNVFTMMINNQ
jgi:hypothetical protein